jgi:hypothetical protein
MRQFIERIKLVIQIARMWRQALDLTAGANFSTALRVVRDMEALGASRAELTLLKGFLLFRVAEHEDALETLIVAYERISRDAALAPPNNKYLMCYASVWGQKAMKSLGREVETPFAIDFRDVPLKLVQRPYKRNFPLREHPDWSR